MVREYPALYNTGHEDYMKTKLKDKIWDKIAKQTNYPNGEAAKDQWRKLRDCHRDALRRQKRKGLVGIVTKSWMYQKQMEFLLPYMFNKNTSAIMNDTIEEINSESQCQEEASSDAQNDDIQLQIQDSETESDISFFNKDREHQISKSPQSKTKKTDIASLLQLTYEKHNRNSKEREVIRKQIIEEKRREEMRKNDALYQFFMSMYNSTRAMPKYVQVQVKRKIFESVTVAEEEVIANGTHGSYGQSSSPSMQWASVE
ncbi:hypothetical protein J437_LFUL003154 [Ladona fulva]|uniref:MADF domain-containing protein n=1 Tax=Ladona fulva TaxID=123851 RepID=A0A8K0P8W5_LADFU|nr:hypothetical protein J437_LFUL003154 [Ladona fulva]